MPTFGYHRGRLFMSKLIPLYGKYGQGKFALIDDDLADHISQHRWNLMPDGCPARRVRSQGKIQCEFMHHLVLARKPGLLIDHVNRRRSDNRRENLRYATPGENACNNSMNIGNTSGYTGVGWYPRHKKWISHIMSNKVNYTIGYFESKEEAAIAYNIRAQQLHGAFAHLNDPALIPDYDILLPIVVAKIESILAANNTSGRRGVSWHNNMKKWKVQVKHSQTMISVGYFNDLDEAAYIFDQCALQLHGEKAKLNILTGPSIPWPSPTVDAAQ